MTTPSIPSINVPDRATRTILDALKRRVEAQDRALSALAARMGSATPAQVTQTIVQQSAPAPTPEPFEPDELMAAPYPPISPANPASAFGPGFMRPWPGAEADVPAGWLICDGSIETFAQYPALGAVLGSIWGGNGTTTFGLPPMSGRYIQGVDVGEDVGDLVGNADHEIDLQHDHGPGTLATNTAGSHNHTGITGGPNDLTEVEGDAVTTPVDVGSDIHTHTISTDGDHSHMVNAGTTDTALDTPVDIRPQTAVMYWIIKT